MSDYVMQPEPLGFCRWCGVEVTPDSFRDVESVRDYELAASCQRCQDAVHLGGSDEDPAASYPVRSGLAVGAVEAEHGVREIALLPFLFVAATRRLVWEPRHIVRAGASLPPVDPWMELAPMYGAWTGHTIRVLGVASPCDPLVVGALAERTLVIGLDQEVVRFAGELCANLHPPSLVNLAVEVPWRNAYGSPLTPVPAFLGTHIPGITAASARTRRASALRQCALVARLLELEATIGRDAGLTAFELLLHAHAARFEDSHRGWCRDRS